MPLKFISLLFLITLSVECYSQIDITFPVSRIVFQRDLNNEAIVEVAGNFTVICDQIDARLSPLVGYAGTDTQWQNIISNPQNGIYKGEIKAKGGWYNLEIRALSEGQVVGYTTLQRIGVGEVFLVAGQSNAEGNLDFEGAEIGTNEDRVSAVNYKDIFMQEDKLPFIFSQLNDNTKIGPYHPVPWIWAVMAEKIVQRYQVPVLLFGAGVGGMGSELWYRSLNGEDLTGPFGLQVKFAGSPYAVLSRTLKNYVSKTGIRAVLWQQGESDRLTPQDTYIRNIRGIIEQSRYDLNENIPWIIGQSSRTPFESPQVIAAQYQITQQVPNTYLGPNTDVLFGFENRVDGIHFHQGGIKRAGDLWFQAIVNRNIFAAAPPVSAKKMATTVISCLDFNQDLKVGIQESNLKPFWSNGTYEQSTSIQNGSISSIVRDERGILYPSQTVRISTEGVKKPSLRIEGDLSFCFGQQSTKLIAQDAFNYEWQDGSKSASISPTSSGEYFFKAKSLYGCQFFSDKVPIQVFAKPEPKLNIDNFSFKICERDTIELRTTEQYAEYQLDGIETNREFEISKAGSYVFEVVSENNCKSDPINLNVSTFPIPQEPRLIQNGTFFINSTVRANEDEKILWYLNNSLIDEDASEIKIKTSGDYSVQFRRTYNLEGQVLTCTSERSNTINIVINENRVVAYPNPTAGELTIETVEDYDNFKLFVFDVSGKTHISELLGSSKSKVKIDLSHLQSGAYILYIKTKYDVLQKQLIISK